VNGDAILPRLDQAEPVAGPPPELERTIARLLTRGTYASVLILAVGTAIMLIGGVRPFTTEPAFDLGRIGDDLLNLRAAGFLWLGLLAVIATPATRVVASLVGYLRAGERSMAIVATLILVVIALSVGLARTIQA
jgi:uncharacterized membrane protein